MKDHAGDRMSVRAALGVLTQLRDDSTLVVTNQGSARVWPLLGEHPLDFHYNPSTMGGAIPFGLGLALARPALHVMVVSGDGALSMSLGSLISVVAARVEKFTVVLLDNGIYEVTGGQRIAASEVDVDYAGLARSVGFPSAFGFGNETDWREGASTALAAPGPRLISLRVEKSDPADMATSLPPIADRLSALTRTF